MTTDPLADAEVTGLVTLQFAWGSLIFAEPAENPSLIHLVRSTGHGTPGPTLCDIDRLAKDGPGWSVGGGITGPDITLTPCPGCAAVAREQFPGLPVGGSVGGREMAEHLGVSHARI
jgi:hypothetical protein